MDHLRFFTSTCLQEKNFLLKKKTFTFCAIEFVEYEKNGLQIPLVSTSVEGDGSSWNQIFISLPFENELRQRMAMENGSGGEAMNIEDVTIHTRVQASSVVTLTGH